MPRSLRRLLAPVLSAVLAVAVAVPATWYVANRSAPDPASELAPVPSGPADRDELRERLLAQLPDPDADGAVLLEVTRERETVTAMPPGRYGVHLICGQMRVQGDAVYAFRLFLRTEQQYWTIELPCPSTPLTADEGLDFTGVAAGAVAAGLTFEDTPLVGFLLLVQLVPVAGQGGGAGE